MCTQITKRQHHACFQYGNFQLNKYEFIHKFITDYLFFCQENQHEEWGDYQFTAVNYLKEKFESDPNQFKDNSPSFQKKNIKNIRDIQEKEIGKTVETVTNFISSIMTIIMTANSKTPVLDKVIEVKKVLQTSIIRGHDVINSHGGSIDAIETVSRIFQQALIDKAHSLIPSFFDKIKHTVEKIGNAVIRWIGIIALAYFAWKGVNSMMTRQISTPP